MTRAVAKAPRLNLTPTDLDLFRKIKVPPDLLEEAGIQRVTDREARDLFGFHFNGPLDGILFPYYPAGGGDRVNARIRRDTPEMKNGKPSGKYISADRDKRRLYYPPGSAGLLGGHWRSRPFRRGRKIRARDNSMGAPYASPRLCCGYRRLQWMAGQNRKGDVTERRIRR